MASSNDQDRKIELYKILNSLKNNTNTVFQKNEETQKEISQEEQQKKEKNNQKAINDAVNGLEKLKGEYILWYPHSESGVDRKIGSKFDNNSPTSDLEKYGAYHFTIKFYPEVENNKSYLENTNDTISTHIESHIESAINQVAKFVGLGDTTFYKALTNSLTQGSTFITEYLDNVVNAVSSGGSNQEEGLVTPSPNIIYKNMKSLYTAEIYLPLESYQVRRSSGITQQKDMQSNIAATMGKFLASELDNALGKGVTNIIKANVGQTTRDMVAPRIDSGAISLDKKSLNWSFFPRNNVEMEHIISIIRFLSSSAVPRYNKNSFFFKMPPVVQLEAITTDYTQKPCKKRILSPKREYYITDMNINISEGENGGVILTPEGYPMYITINVELMKTDLNSFMDLFIYPFM